MSTESTLTRLAQSIAPSDAFRQKVLSRVQARMQPQSILETIAGVSPSPSFAATIKQRILRTIGVEAASDLRSVATALHPSSLLFARIKERVLASLQPIEEAPMLASGLKWASAFVVFLVILRSLPIFFLAPSTSAEVGIQLLPADGTVSVYVGGVWTDVTNPQILKSAAMIRTGASSHATVILGDKGVFRLGAETLLKVHAILSEDTQGPTATLIRGDVWALGLLPPVSEGISVEMSSGIASVNVGSISISDDGTVSSVTVYDRGATVKHATKTIFAVTGERVLAREPSSPLQITSLPLSAFADPWVTKNLQEDAVHRHEIAQLQEDRRVAQTGILPTSFLYPAKRFAERVDTFFTLTQDGRTEKRISQANSRLNEAIALLKAGQSDEATVPLSEYKNSLIAMAEDTKDNLVKYLLKKQIADASVSLSASDSGNTHIAFLQTALKDIGTAMPNVTLDSRDIEGYILVDRLAQINQQLSHNRDIQGAVSAYTAIRPYMQSLLADDSGVHPLLKKEAMSLLVTTSTLVQEAMKLDQGAVLTALASDIAPYLPQENDTIRVSEAELNARVQKMYDRIFIFRAPLSRYNQLQTEMANIKGDPNRGTLLRRLKAALPVALGEYVNTEIRLLGDELKSNAKSLASQEDEGTESSTGL